MAFISFENIIWIFVSGFFTGIGFTILLMVRSKETKKNKGSKRSNETKDKSNDSLIGGGEF